MIDPGPVIGHNARMTINAAILGPTGYTGLHLIQLLQGHPQAEVTYLASARDEPTDIRTIFPKLDHVVARDVAICRPIDPAAIAQQADVAFVALPHGVSMNYVPQLLDAGLRVVDLSADYRLRDPAVYETVYGQAHGDRAHLRHAVYGLPELFRDDLPRAKLIANPGCYPTAAALGLAPLLRAGVVAPNPIMINAASGASGAGRKPATHLLLAEQYGGFGPYGQIGGHRHGPEINQTLTAVGGAAVEATFVPHLLPIGQGILETIYAHPAKPGLTEEDLYSVYEQAYGAEPFVRVRRGLPNVCHVAGTNFCDVSVRVVGTDQQRWVIVFSAIDNLIKGASGQAVQNMNVLFDLDETAGLHPYG